MKKERKPKPCPKYLQDLLMALTYFFGLQNYDRIIEICDKPDTDANGSNLAASVDIQEDYQRIYIYIYPCFFNKGRKVQREYLLHEFSHSITDGLRHVADSMRAGKLITPEQIRFENERATSKISLMVDSLLQGFESNTRKAYKTFLTAKK